MNVSKYVGAFALAMAISGCGLVGCASNSAPSSSAESVSSAAATSSSDAAVTREEINAVVDAATATECKSMGFSTKTETTATAQAQGQMQQQTVETSMVGQLDKSSGSPRMHMAYTSKSSSDMGSSTSYDMYLEGSTLLVTQGDQLYRDTLAEGALDGYVRSVTSAASKEEINQLLDAASSYKMTKQDDGSTVLSITADIEKLADAGLYDASSLPEGSAIATLVASYTIDAENHVKSVRIMSSTTGTPTYRVSQTYQYSDFDNVTMPEWPSWEDYVAQQTGLLTDENGRMYMTDESGQVYYVENISPDGMISFATPE